MKLGLKDAQNLLSISQGEVLRRSMFGKGSLKLLDAMIELGALRQNKITRNSFDISLGRKEPFNGYLLSYLFIDDLNKHIEALSLQNPSRSELSQIGVSTKIKSTSPKSGVHINSPDAIDVLINRESVRLSFPSGCALFVHKSSEIVIKEDVLIVGVENFENISGKLKDRTIFPDAKIIFIERNKVLQNLLAEVSNRYLHFGDIDLAGISIYQNEYEHIVKDRGSFFIPADIESLITKGLAELYENQKEKYSTLIGNTSRIQSLINLINKNKKSIEQEIFLDSSRYRV